MEVVITGTKVDLADRDLLKKYESLSESDKQVFTDYVNYLLSNKLLDTCTQASNDQ